MKALKWLVVLLALAALAAVVYLILPRTSQTPSAASLLPENTFLFVHVRDVPTMRAQWKTTALYKIWSEKQVQDFLARARAFAETMLRRQTGDNPYLGLARRMIELPQGELFLAVTEMGSAPRQIPNVAVGFDVKENREGAEQWIADLRELAGGRAGGFAEEQSDHNGVSYRRWTGQGATLCQAFFGSLLVVTSSEETLIGMIDRYQGKESTSLAAREAYREAEAKMPSAHLVFAYSNMEPLVNMLKGFAMFMPQLQEGVKNLAAVQAASYSMTIEDGSIRDVIFVKAPSEKRGEMGAETKPTERKSLPLTSAQALFYSVQTIDLARAWEKTHEQLQQNPMPQLQEALFRLDKFNREHNVNMPQEFLEAVGPEVATSLSWENESPVPSFFVAMEVRDRAKAEAALHKLWQIADSATSEGLRALFSSMEIDGHQVQSLHVPMLPLSPSYVLSDRFFFLTSNLDTAKRLLAKLSNGGPNLADNATYQKTMESLPDGGYSYAYLDTRPLFERLYNVLSPYAPLAASKTPRASRYVDLSKLPESKSISQYLQPCASAQVVDKDGFTTVMISPVGLPTVAAGAMVGAAVAIAQNFPHFPLK